MNNKIFNLIIAFSLFNLTFVPLAIQAEIPESNQNQPGPPPDAPKFGRGQGGASHFRQPEPPPDAPKSGRAKGGASRGKCSFASSTLEEELTLIPVLPSNGWGLTVSESPTVWVYISYLSGRFDGETPLKAELSVEERQTDTKLEPKSYPLELPRTSGIFSISLPHSLASNKWYRWYLVVNCQGEDASANDVLQVEGFLHRKGLKDLTKPPESDNKSELVIFYTDNNIWYDAFHEAALLDCNNRSNNELKNYWQSLLKSDEIELDEVSNRSVICPN